MEPEEAVKPFKKAQEEEDPYAGIVKKKSKRKGGNDTAAATKSKSVRLSHSPEDFAVWEKLGFTAPSSSDECPALYEELLAKREVCSCEKKKGQRTNRAGVVALKLCRCSST